jgi:hypothetical protein
MLDAAQECVVRESQQLTPLTMLFAFLQLL